MIDARRIGADGRPAWAVALTLLVAVLAVAGDVGAESWGGISPGETTRAGVERLYGRPSRERTLVDEGRTVAEWTYAEDRAPRGLIRMVISYGLMVNDRFTPDVVRSIVLYPRPQLFTGRIVFDGWGEPDAIGTEEATGRPSFHYRTRGLLVIFDKTASWAELLVFGPRQPKPAGGS